MTINEAGRRLGVNRTLIRGCALGLGITPTPLGRALVITWDDFERIKAAISTMPTRKTRRRALAGATS